MWRRDITAWDDAPLTPRDCQRAALAALMVSPTASVATLATGAGKARIVAELARMWSGRVLVTCPTVALVDQLADDVQERIGLDRVGRVYTHAQRVARVTIACMPSMSRAMELLSGDAPDLLWIADEAHRTSSDYAECHPAMRLGLSATPYTAIRGEGLLRWEREVYRYTAADAVRDGVLVPWSVAPWPGGAIDSTCADWIADSDGPGVVSAHTIPDALAFSEMLDDRGVAAAVVHSGVSRAAILGARDRLRKGDLRCLVHVRMLVEGVDMPWLRWAVLRASRSRVGLVQEVGRVLRTAPGKSRAWLLDPRGLLDEHGLIHPADLGTTVDGGGSGGSSASEPYDMDLAIQAARDALDATGRRADDELTAWARAVVDALIVANVADVATLSAGRWRGWRAEAATQRQLDYLRQWRGEAEKMALGGPHSKRAHALWLRVQCAQVPKRGAVSDVLTILKAFATRRADARDALAAWGVE